MNRRLYFLVHNVTEAKQVFDELLLARVTDKHIHVLAKEGVDLSDLPYATAFQRFDIIHSLIVGCGAGALIGIFAGVIGHGFLGAPLGGIMLATTLLGALLGAWSASMIGLMVPNSQLRPFQNDIDQGKLLMMVDVPLHKVNQIQALIRKHLPAVKFGGVEPTVPSFP